MIFNKCTIDLYYVKHELFEWVRFCRIVPSLNIIFQNITYYYKTSGLQKDYWKASKLFPEFLNHALPLVRGMF